MRGGSRADAEGFDVEGGKRAGLPASVMKEEEDWNLMPF